MKATPSKSNWPQPDMSSRTFVLAGSGSFSSYEAVRPLFRAVVAVVERECPQLSRRYGSALAQLAGDRPKGDALIENDPRLVLRRLSRESIGLAHDIDNLSRFLIAAQASCPTLAGTWCLTVENAVQIDRPSLRLLARLGALRRLTTAQLNFELCCGDWAIPDGGLGIDGALQETRAEMVRVVANAWGVGAGHAAKPEQQRRSCCASAAAAFSQQNYEAVVATADGDGIDALLLRTLTLVNLDRVDLALEGLTSAVATAAPAVRATIHYLTGLVLVKRKQALGDGIWHFAEGLRLNEPVDAASQLERGWLLNGMALAQTLQALGGPREGRVARLAALVDNQTAIMDMIPNEMSEETLYLRYNILANTSLLLEAMGSHETACEFWQRAFGEAYAGAQSSTVGALAFHYRHGMLAMKAGRTVAARESLERALAASRNIRANLLESRIHYALGWLAFTSGEFKTTDNCWSVGHEAAIREADIAQQDQFSHALAALAAGNRNAPPPPSKISSYLGHIDLDPEPRVDLNRRISAAAAPVHA